MHNRCIFMIYARSILSSTPQNKRPVEDESITARSAEAVTRFKGRDDEEGDHVSDEEERSRSTVPTQKHGRRSRSKSPPMRDTESMMHPVKRQNSICNGELFFK